jgi:hypothetical protein
MDVSARLGLSRAPVLRASRCTMKYAAGSTIIERTDAVIIPPTNRRGDTLHHLRAGAGDGNEP